MLWQLAATMDGDTWTEAELVGFNDSHLCCLPTKAYGPLADGTAYFSPAHTRPLAIGNCDNRLIANAVRLCYEDTLASAISSMQQGFLPGRSLLRNVVSVDAQMRESALRGGDPAAIFYDFHSAFPSLSQTFLFRVLRSLGLPDAFCRVVENLYWGHACTLALPSGHHSGFPSCRASAKGAHFLLCFLLSFWTCFFWRFGTCPSRSSLGPTLMT